MSDDNDDDDDNDDEDDDDNALLTTMNLQTWATAKLDTETRAIDEVVESLLFDEFNHLRRYTLLQLSSKCNSTANSSSHCR